VTFKTAGTKTVTATDTILGTITGTSAGVTVTPDVAAKLVFDTSALPPTAVAENATWTTFNVEIQDQYSNVVTSDNATDVTVAASVGTLGGTLTQTASTGVATFAGISYPTATPVTPITVTATSAPVLTSVTSDAITVSPVPTTTRTLGTGWNMFSTPFPLRDYYRKVSQILTISDIASTDVEVAYYYNAATSSFVQITTAADYELKPCDAIFIKMISASKTMSLIANDQLSVPSKSLAAGWNAVGLAYWDGTTAKENTVMDVDDALLSAYWVAVTGKTDDVWGYIQVVKPALNQTGFIYLRGNAGGLGTIPQMKVMEGGWVFMVNPGELGGFTSTPLP